MSDAPPAPATGTEGQPPAPPPPPPEPTSTDPPEPKPTDTVEFWRTQARENEKRAKANSAAVKELEKLKAQTMSDTEKAVEAARAEGRKEATSDNGQKLAAAEIKAALTGVVPDPGAIVEDINLAKYVTDDGDVDADAVAKLRKKFEALNPAAPPAKPGSRPKENLRTVPVVSNGETPKIDMNNWMREQANRQST